MKQLIYLHTKLILLISHAKDIPLLLIRLTLAYGFYIPAKMKLANIPGITAWFAEIGIPAPALNAYLATGTETAGVILLTLGLGTRFIAIPLMVTMLVAIKTVHWNNGFEAANNGYEIPLYYLLMLLLLLTSGGGKFGLDRIISKKLNK